MDNKQTLIDDVKREFESVHGDLWRDYVSNEPSHLYHYTSTEGLVGITQNLRFFLSDVLSFTDQSEISHGIDIFRAVLSEAEQDLFTECLLHTLQKAPLLGFGELIHMNAVCFCGSAQEFDGT